MRGKSEWFGGIHYEKLDPVRESSCLRLRPGVLDHLPTDVDAGQLHVRIDLGCFENPAARPAAHIEDTVERGRIVLFGQETAHAFRHEALLNHEADQFRLASLVLYKICAGIILSPWIDGF